METMTNIRPIGFIDSGGGGVTVGNEAIKPFPNASLL
jgi:glutamate racemase